MRGTERGVDSFLDSHNRNHRSWSSCSSSSDLRKWRFPLSFINFIRLLYPTCLSFVMVLQVIMRFYQVVLITGVCRDWEHLEYYENRAEAFPLSTATVLPGAGRFAAMFLFNGTLQ